MRYRAHIAMRPDNESGYCNFEDFFAIDDDDAKKHVEEIILPYWRKKQSPIKPFVRITFEKLEKSESFEKVEIVRKDG